MRSDSTAERALMRYELIVKGSVSAVVLAALPGFRATPYPTGGTALFGPVRDEPEVTALLRRLTDLRIAVIETRQLPD